MLTIIAMVAANSQQAEEQQLIAAAVFESQAKNSRSS